MSSLLLPSPCPYASSSSTIFDVAIKVEYVKNKLTNILLHMKFFTFSIFRLHAMKLDLGCAPTLSFLFLCCYSFLRVVFLLLFFPSNFYWSWNRSLIGPLTFGQSWSSKLGFSTPSLLESDPSPKYKRKSRIFYTFMLSRWVVS